MFIQASEVAFEYFLDIILVGFQTVFKEYIMRQSTVCTAGKTDVASGIGKAKTVGKRLGKRLDPSAVGADESAVNVEQYDAKHGARTIGWLIRPVNDLTV